MKIEIPLLPKIRSSDLASIFLGSVSSGASKIVSDSFDSPAYTWLLKTAAFICLEKTLTWKRLGNREKVSIQWETGTTMLSKRQFPAVLTVFTVANPRDGYRASIPGTEL